MANKSQNALSTDVQTKVMMYEGLTVSQLCTTLRMDRKTVVRKLYGVTATGVRAGADIYDLPTVLPYLVRPQFDVEEAIKRMNHQDLPKHLTKEFWNGLRAKQEWELKAGNLWPTEKVIEHASELFKIVRMQVLLTMDTVERNQELSPRQREVVKSEMDGLLRNLRKEIKQKFGEPKKVEVKEDDDEEL